MLFFAIHFALLLAMFAADAQAGWPHRSERVAQKFSSTRPWHGNYAYTPAGGPVALVVPPTADSMASWSWGVSQSEINPLYHQFGRNYPAAPGYSSEGSPFLPTPYYPSHTDQFGVYPVRGPWR